MYYDHNCTYQYRILLYSTHYRCPPEAILSKRAEKRCSWNVSDAVIICK